MEGLPLPAKILLGVLAVIFIIVAIFLGVSFMNREQPLTEEEIETMMSEIDPKDRVIITFEDKKLNESMNKIFNKAGGITQNEMESLTELSLKSSEIRNLKGLEYAINLEKLDLYDNEIRDISEIGKMKKLKELDLSNNNIRDIKVVSLLENLNKLEIMGNEIQDASNIGGLKNLKYLDVSNNYIESCGFAESLTNLKTLKLQKNMIRNVEPLKSLPQLDTLWIQGNKFNRSQIEEFPHIKNLVTEN